VADGLTLGIPLAVLASALFGTGDFLGGLAARRASALMVTLVVSVLGALPTVLLLGQFPGVPTGADLLWGVGSGVSGALGVTLLYHVLARGPVGVMAPIVAVCGVAVPVAAGLALGERPTWAAGFGMLLAAGAVLLVSASAPAGGDGATRPRAERAVVLLAVLAGLGLGGFLVLLARVGPAAGLLPLVTARAAGAVTVLLVLLARREPLALPPAARVPAIAGALVDGVANVLYLLVVRSHAVSIVGTIVSLGPGFAVVLGHFVLRERFTRTQVLGLACAAVAIVLLTGGGDAGG